MAVALTLAGDARSGPLDLVTPPPAETGSGGGGLLDHVAGLDHDRLVELIVAQADTDWRLRERLVAEAQASATADAPERFDAVLLRACTEHRAKRNLKAMLDGKGWPDQRE